MKNTLEKAIGQYGSDMQHIVAIEELSELQKEITKTLRGYENRDHLIEEIVDVKIMLEQLILMHNITSSEQDDLMIKKVNRLMCRLNTNNGSA